MVPTFLNWAAYIMKLGDGPCYRDFTFEYKGVSIYVPVSLNEMAKSKKNTFWDWLLFKYSFESYIELTLEHFIEEELT